MQRLSEILLEIRSAHSKILMLKLACSLALLDLCYLYGDQVYVGLKFARLAQKFWLIKLARSLEPPLGFSTKLITSLPRKIFLYFYVKKIVYVMTNATAKGKEDRKRNEIFVLSFIIYSCTMCCCPPLHK